MADKIITILGLSFKPNTDDVRDSTSIKIATLLIEKGAKIKSYDPQAMENAKEILPEIHYCSSFKEACEKSEAIIIATEWNEFRALDFNKIKNDIKNPIIFDLRNIYNKNDFEILGLEYYGIGK
jgi:UDPglucose 6-dehydrogenase